MKQKQQKKKKKQLYFTVYKTTNLVNGKIYIGKHITEDPNDRYLGSGHLFYKAVRKYGVKNFKKEVLFIFDNEEEMLDKERELVNEGYIISKHTHTSYTDIYQMTPTEREAIVRCIIADYQKIQQLKDQVDQNKG